MAPPKPMSSYLRDTTLGSSFSGLLCSYCFLVVPLGSEFAPRTLRPSGGFFHMLSISLMLSQSGRTPHDLELTHGLWFHLSPPVESWVSPKAGRGIAVKQSQPTQLSRHRATRPRPPAARVNSGWRRPICQRIAILSACITLMGEPD